MTEKIKPAKDNPEKNLFQLTPFFNNDAFIEIFAGQLVADNSLLELSVEYEGAKHYFFAQLAITMSYCFFSLYAKNERNSDTCTTLLSSTGTLEASFNNLYNKINNFTPIPECDIFAIGVFKKISTDEMGATRKVYQEIRKAFDEVSTIHSSQ